MRARAEQEVPAGRGTYFFLSYAHSPPLAGSLGTEPEPWVRRLFDDLTESVRRHGDRESELSSGFYDQKIPYGDDWKASLTAALSGAQVFVPLYSAGYLARAWPGREWACFHRRLVLAGVRSPLRRFVPVLWSPLPRGQDPPGLREVLAEVAEPAYAENGLRALLRLRQYRDAYTAVVDRLARRIVRLAETFPLESSTVPDIDSTPSEFKPEASTAVFSITIAAPTIGTLPPERDSVYYGEASADWRPFPDRQILSLAAYAAGVAERFDFAVVVDGIENSGTRRANMPGIVLIDPWFVAEGQRQRMLDSFVKDLPSWVLPLLVRDASADVRGAQLAERVRDILQTAGAMRTEAARRAGDGVNSLEDFVSIMPILLAEAERQYLRHGPMPQAAKSPGDRPRLGGAPPPDPSIAGPDQ